MPTPCCPLFLAQANPPGKQNARKIWIFSYSTASARLLKKGFAVTFVKPKERPYTYGPWEFDTHDGKLPLDANRMELIRKATAQSYMSARAAGKQAMEAAFPTKPPDPPADEGDDGVDDEEAAFLFGSEDSNYEIDDDALAKSIPQGVRSSLIDDYVKQGGSTQYTNKAGKKKDKHAKFIAKYSLVRFPKGFYFQHFVVDECQLVRNPMTGISRLLRLLIKMSYRSRSDKETSPSSLVMVSATPAINQVTDYRGLSSLF